MSTTPPSGPKVPEQTPKPIQPSKGVSKMPSGQPKEEASVSNSPFAKMFERSGVTPTAKQIHMMMSTLLKQTLTDIKKNDERWKKAMRKLKREIEGKD